VAIPTESPEILAERWLAAAYGFVESGWCQGAAARDDSGNPIKPESALARSWSATGALTRAWRESGRDDETGLRALQFANLALSAAVHAVPTAWNDTPGRRQHEVLEALLDAVSLVRDPAVFGSGDGNGSPVTPRNAASN
jgi:hypothetical protein